MPDRSLGEPTEYVIWAASGLLALLLGLGAAFFLWAALHRSTTPALPLGAIGSLGLGLLLIGLAADRPMTRAFFVLLALTLVLAYLLGGSEFARLAPS